MDELVERFVVEEDGDSVVRVAAVDEPVADVSAVDASAVPVAVADGEASSAGAADDVTAGGVTAVDDGSSPGWEPHPALSPAQLASTSAASARFMVSSVAGRALQLLVKRQGEAVLQRTDELGGDIRATAELVIIVGEQAIIGVLQLQNRLC